MIDSEPRMGQLYDHTCRTPIRAVLFDAVGTLFHSQIPITRVYANAGQSRGLAISEAEVAQRFTPAFLRHFRRVTPGEPVEHTATGEDLERQRWRAVVGDVFCEGNEVSAKTLDSLFDELWGHFSRGSSWRLFDDVEPTWTALRSQGILVGIASNYDSRLLSVLRDLPPLDQCRHVYHSAAVGHAKPGREFFRAIERSLGIPREHLLFVGDDHNNDYLGAQDAGWHSLWLVRGPSQEGDSHRIHSLCEVLNRVNPPASSPGG